MSIRLRFTLALTTVGLVLFGAYALWTYGTERRELREAATSELRLVGQALETALGNAVRDAQRADVDEVLAALESFSPELRIWLSDVKGERLARSAGADTDELVRQRMAEAIGDPRDVITFDPPDDPDRIIFSGALTNNDGTVIGAIAVVRSTRDLREDLARTRPRLALALLGFVAVTVVVGLLLGTVHITRPIARLSKGIQHVRSGDFRTRVNVARADELGGLADQFNAMITALERATDARAKLEAGLQRVDKLIAIGQLSAGLAHEIGSPLQVLSGRASTLLDHRDPEVKRQAAQLVTQCDRITRVVEQLLSFGRRSAAARGPCDPKAPVMAVLDLLSAEARRRSVELTLEQDGADHRIDGDIDQLQQITLNLVRNALEATPAGGSIVVRIARVDDCVRLSVRDTGVGIDPAVRERLFEPFFTTRAAHGGTGLGLAVVRSIADGHNASIDVISEPGTGAELVVTFPAREEPPHA